jgi:hypothetical protein
MKCTTIFLKYSRYNKQNYTYLGVERDRVELLHPLISGKDDLLCLCITFSFHSNMASMIYKVNQVAGVYRINDIEKELSFWGLLREELVWEECLYLLLRLYQVKDLLDAELLVYGDFDKVNRREFKKSLFSNEDLLYKVLVVASSRREVVLKLI